MLLCSDVEAKAISRASSVEAAAGALLRAGVRAAVVVTLGAEGALALGVDRARLGGVVLLRQRAARGAAVADTTGAGDAFNAGFLHVFHATGGDLRAALSWGCACGTACCAHVGASPALEVEQIEALRVGKLG